MHSMKLYVEDSVFDKVMYFLKNLPKNEVKIVEETKHCDKNDFIEFMSSNPFSFSQDTFLSRDDANAR